MDRETIRILAILDDKEITGKLKELIPSGREVTHLMHSETRLDRGLEYLSENTVLVAC